MFTVYCWIGPTKPQMFPTRPFLTSGRSAGCATAGGIWGTMPQAAHCIWGRPTCWIHCHGAVVSQCGVADLELPTVTGRPQCPVELRMAQAYQFFPDPGGVFFSPFTRSEP